MCKLLGGPGEVSLDGSTVLVGYDFDHVHKNVRNNWITEPNKELSFTMDGKEYPARWKDVVALYEEDQISPFRLTKLSYSSVFTKPLQRQNINLVCQVFNEKTVAAMRTLQPKLAINDGTIKWIELISQSFRMMSVKSKYQASRFNDSYREVWSSGCDSFQRSGEISTVVSICDFTGVRGRRKKLKQQTGNAFLVATDTNIRAAKMLIETHEFEYVIPAVFSQNPLEKFFGQCRQRVGGNFYIDIGDVIASAKAQHLHQLLKYDIVPVGDGCDVVRCVMLQLIRMIWDSSTESH